MDTKANFAFESLRMRNRKGRERDSEQLGREKIDTILIEEKRSKKFSESKTKMSQQMTIK